MSRILITGSSSGLGRALADELTRDHHQVIGYDIACERDVRVPDLRDSQGRLINKLDVLINCAAVNRINWLADVTSKEWDEVLDTNVKGMFLMSQACAPMLKESRGTILNIVSNAAHMPMRSSAAYNASKGAALILTKQLARELSPEVTVFSVSPNKLAGTAMSDSIDEQVVRVRGWTKEQAQKYQLAGLLSGKETPVQVVAEFIAFLLKYKHRHDCLTGCDIPYGA